MATSISLTATAVVEEIDDNLDDVSQLGKFTVRRDDNGARDAVFPRGFVP